MKQLTGVTVLDRVRKGSTVVVARAATAIVDEPGQRR
jgi:hypothetical protein